MSHQRQFIRFLANHTEATGQQLRDVDEALSKVKALPWLQVLFTLLPFIMQIFSGQPIDFQALIAAILALLNPPKP